MRATKGPAFECDITLNAKQQREFEAQAKRLKISVPEAIALSAELAAKASLPLPPRSGKILTFETLKREPK